MHPGVRAEAATQRRCLGAKAHDGAASGLLAGPLGKEACACLHGRSSSQPCVRAQVATPFVQEERVLLMTCNQQGNTEPVRAESPMAPLKAREVAVSLNVARVAQCFGFIIGMIASVGLVPVSFSAVVETDAGPGQKPTIRSGDAGLELVALSDGRALNAELIGPKSALHDLTTGGTEMISLTEGDLDGDGMPDLVVGYEWRGRGLAVIHRGNVDSLWPDTEDADERKRIGAFSTEPFLSTARVIELPTRADFLGVGDFDSDGVADLVVATHESALLHFVLGNADGVFDRILSRELPGKFTSAVVGDMNRRDGIVDLAVAVDGRSGARMLVFEGPAGAAVADAEVLEMPDTVTSVVLGHLDEQYEPDLAAACGQHVVVVYGRDRRLSQSRTRREAVSGPRVEHYSFRVPSPFLPQAIFSDRDAMSWHASPQTVSSTCSIPATRSCENA